MADNQQCQFVDCKENATTLIFSDAYNREAHVCDEHCDRAIATGFWEVSQCS